MNASKTSDASTRPRLVVSLESVAVPARHAILKHLQSRLGMSAIVDVDRYASPFASLLHRLRALARLPRTQDVLWCGAWLPNVPAEPVLRALYREASDALQEALVLGESRHLMVCMHACADELFETMVVGEESRDVSLEEVRDASSAVGKAHESSSPFAMAIIERIACPAYAADNPATVDVVCRRAYEAIAKHVGP